MKEIKIDLWYKKVFSHAIENNVKKMALFIKDEKLVLELQKYLMVEGIDITLVAVTFPSNEKMYLLNEEEEVEETVIDAANGFNVKNLIENEGIKYVSSALPFEGIVIPGTSNDNPYKIIEKTLTIIHKALPNLVQTLLMATDSGNILPKERVLVVNTQLAIDACGSNTRLMFHPNEGIKINELIYNK